MTTIRRNGADSGKSYVAAYGLLACAVAAAITPAKAQAATETVLHNFASPPRGADPYQGITRDSAGNIYGASEGGRYGFGVVYKLDTAGNQAVLHTFTGGTDGGNPSGVTLDPTGSLYGTASSGGTANAGLVYKLDQAGQQTVLYNFTGGADGGYPAAGVTLDPAGNLYGTTSGGGSASVGVVYKLDASLRTTTGCLETVLHTFSGGDDGRSPMTAVIRDAAGNLYGTTFQGGSGYSGVVYKLDPSGQETVLHNFTGGADGGYPESAVIRDSAGNLYGTCDSGGSFYDGVVYEVDQVGNETVLYSFTGGADGGNVQGGVIRDAAGNLYGTTTNGGSANKGVIYKLDTSLIEMVLYNFTGSPDGSFPYVGVIGDSSGNLYGATQQGGTANLGAVYKLDKSLHETVLYSFPGPADGSLPYSGVIRDAVGNFYGTTYGGGAYGYGVVYEMDAQGHETVLYTFTGGTDGGNPQAGVIRDSAGNLYGTTYTSGAYGYGVVYKVDTAGHETVLYNFTGGADGANPTAGVIQGPSGNLYGTTYFGGTASQGVVFELDTSGNERVLHSFLGGSDGGYPQAGVIRDPAGNLYGTTSGGFFSTGTVYKVTAGGERVLYSFPNAADGIGPSSGLIRDSAGNLYGTTATGGTVYAGVVYKLDTTGQETVLYSFTGGADGDLPNGLAFDTAGNIYVTTLIGGASSQGTILELDTSGNATVLYTFTGGTSGGQPNGGAIIDSAGKLFGTTQNGGLANTGVVYQIKTQ
jgi:uncharacterized repeat protein (TIGR03803 family)